MASKPSAKSETPSKLPPELAASKLLTTDQVGQLLGDVSKRTLEDWRRLGTGPDYVPFGKTMVRYRPEAVAAFIAARERKLSGKAVA